MKKILQSKKNIIILVLAVMLIISLPNITKAISLFEEQIKLIQEVYNYIQIYHVSNINPDELAQGAIDGMIDTLDDPHTKYFTNEEYESFIDGVNGSFTGIGVYIIEKDGYITVQSPIEGSPAYNEGIKTGDKIIKVDGVDITGKTTEEAASLIKGEEGTNIQLTIDRNGELIEKVVVREQINLPIIETEMLTDDIGYLRLYTFSNESAVEFKSEIEQLENCGMEKMILDLRGNPGGYLNAALDISKNFISEGPIVYIKDKNSQEQVLSVENGTEWDKPMVVLIDEGSASASEIVVGALRDYDKATIIGTNSFGKGTVQSLIPLESDGYLKLTINEYFTANKNKINGIGIKPDIEVYDTDEQLIQAINYLSNDINSYIPEKITEYQGNKYVLLKPLFEHFNGNVYYISETKTIRIELDNKAYEYEITNSSDILTKNGKSYININNLKTDFENFNIMQNDILTIYRY